MQFKMTGQGAFYKSQSSLATGVNGSIHHHTATTQETSVTTFNMKPVASGAPIPPSSSVVQNSTMPESVLDSTLSAVSMEHFGFSEAIGITSKDLGGSETIVAMWQLLYRFYCADPETRSRIQFLSSKLPVQPNWGGCIDQISSSGISKGNEMFNQMRNISEHVYSRYCRKKIDKFPLVRLKEFIILEQINTGAVGKIHFGLDRRGQYIAAKVMDKSHIHSNPTLLQRLREEIQIISRIKHRNIVDTRCILECPDKIVHIMEYCDGGDIISFVRQNAYLDEANAQSLFKRTIEGVYYLHRNGIAHRDLKPENLLLCSKRLSPDEQKLNRLARVPIASEYEVKVADFGAATFFNRGKLLYDTVGTLSYAAPEVLKASKLDGYEAEPVDVWSLGILLYAMLFGCLPWNNESKDTVEAYHHVIKSPLSFPNGRFKHISPEVIKLLKSMLTIDPTQRITLSQIRGNKWVVAADKRAIVQSSIRTGRLSVSSTCNPYPSSAQFPLKQTAIPHLPDYQKPVTTVQRLLPFPQFLSTEQKKTIKPDMVRQILRNPKPANSTKVYEEINQKYKANPSNWEDQLSRNYNINLRT